MTSDQSEPRKASRLADIRRRIEDTVGDLPTLTKLGIEQVMRDADPEHDGNLGSAGRVGAQSGNVSELTAIGRLKPGAADRLRRIFKLVRGNFFAAQKVGTLHDMRVVFFDNDTRVLFATSYDGDWDAYINDFQTKIPELMDLIFSAIEGWPGMRDPSIKDFIASCQVPADAWFVANPRTSVADVRRMQRMDKALTEFLDKIG